MKGVRGRGEYFHSYGVHNIGHSGRERHSEQIRKSTCWYVNVGTGFPDETVTLHATPHSVRYSGSERQAKRIVLRAESSSHGPGQRLTQKRDIMGRRGCRGIILGKRLIVNADEKDELKNLTDGCIDFVAFFLLSSICILSSYVVCCERIFFARALSQSHYYIYSSIGRQLSPLFDSIDALTDTLLS